MSSELPLISSHDFIRALRGVGFELIGGGKGSHSKVVHRQRGIVLTVPYRKQLRRGTLRAMIRQAGMSVEEFRALL